MFTRLAVKSLLDRKGSVSLSLIAMTVSIFVLLGVEHIRHQAKDNFSNTVSGVDLVVGARTGSLNLLLYSVFRIGAPTNNISWETYQTIANSNQVKWAIPISLGDSHRGYRVLGTTTDYFEQFSYGKQRKLEFDKGQTFKDPFEVVLGHEAAKQLGYQLGDKLTLSHGMADTSFSRHDDFPFTVVGILAFTGTPVDQTLHVSLEGIEAIHLDWTPGVTATNSRHDRPKVDHHTLVPQSITAIMLGLESKMATFGVQRQINEFADEPLTAILPGVVITELWQMMRILENTLLLVSALVFMAACLGVSAMLLSSIRERQQETLLLRVIGAPASFLFFLIELEALLITIVSCVLAATVLTGCLTLFQDYFISQFGVHVEVDMFSRNSLYLLLTIIAVSVTVAAIPSLYSYRNAKLI